MKPNVQAQKADVRRTLAFYHPDGTTFELCGIGTDRYPKAIDGGFFNDHDEAIKEAMELTQNHNAVYVTINPVTDALLGRANNRIKPGLARTQDKDVTHLRRLLIDADPIRPAKISSTDAERRAAIEVCKMIKTDLSEEGWPEPLIGDSGNGGHLVYHVDLENTPENVDLIKRVLQALAQKYDTDAVKIDQSVFNPSRISKVYGTWTRKGDDTPTRPHRKARIISVPDNPEPVPLELLKALAGSAKTQKPKRSGRTSKKQAEKFDLAQYLEHYEIPVKTVKEHEGAHLHVLETCLFDETHTGGEAAIGQAEDGTLFYQCFHNSCKRKTWRDAREKISGDAKIAESCESGNETQAQLLIQLTADATLFHSPDGGRFAVIPQDDHREVWPIRSKRFKDWLVHRFYKCQDKPPAPQALQNALGVLEAKAHYEGEEYTTFVRIGEHGGNVYLDLGNDSWEAVEITRDGWRVISDPPVKFRRAKTTLALPRPEHGGSLEELRPYLNVPDDGAFRLDSGFLVQALNPSGPYPILILEGEQGTAKSTKARILRSLVDPAKAPLKTVPRDERDLMITATNSWLLAFDNLSGVQPWLSDALCRLSTGGGLATRELYTDAEETVFEATRPIILTGIDHISSRHDLIDRSIIITLPVIHDDKRREEKEMEAEFEAARPRILGALCDAVSCALRNIENTKPDRLPRMADFARWVAAAEPALPWKSGKFIKAYTSNRTGAISLALDADIVACAVRQFMADKLKWEGRATELLEKLKVYVPDDTRKHKSWPKAPNSLSRQLRRSATFLRTVGIEIILPDSGSWRRGIVIRKSPQNIVETDDTVENPPEHESTANDPINDTEEPQKKTVETPLTDKSAIGKAFRDPNDINDKKPTLSKNRDSSSSERSQRAVILFCLEEQWRGPCEMSRADLRAAVGRNVGSKFNTILARMVSDGEIVEPRRGYYMHPDRAMLVKANKNMREAAQKKLETMRLRDAARQKA